MKEFSLLELQIVEQALETYEGAKARVKIYAEFDDYRKEESIRSLEAYESALKKIRNEINQRQKDWNE